MKVTRKESPMEIRKMPSRNAKKKTLNEVITKKKKPAKKSSSSGSSSQEQLSAAKVHSLYTKSELGKFRSTALQTINEVPNEMRDANDNINPFSTTKVRRSIVFHGGQNPTKSVKRMRLNKIKKNFGHIKRTKKLSMEEFFERFNAANEPTASTSTPELEIAEEKKDCEEKGLPLLEPETSTSSPEKGKIPIRKKDDDGIELYSSPKILDFGNC